MTRLERKHEKLKAEVARYAAQVKSFEEVGAVGKTPGTFAVPKLTLNSYSIARGKLAAFESQHPEFLI